MAGDGMRAQRGELTPSGSSAGLPEAVRDAARELGLRGWVRGDAAPGAPAPLHLEGPRTALEALGERLAARGTLRTDPARVEGHEQFAIRGVPAGVFVVQEHQASTHHWDLRLQVGEAMRSWAVPKGPSLDPGVRRLAVQVADHAISHNAFEGPTDSGGVIIWDRGEYEQGGRVAWPEALDRGHAVFVLHGEKLRGGFALQRTRRAEPAQWLLIKRRDDEARPGGEITAERPESVRSGRTLEELRASSRDGGRDADPESV